VIAINYTGKINFISASRSNIRKLSRSLSVSRTAPRTASFTWSRLDPWSGSRSFSISRERSMCKSYSDMPLTKWSKKDE
jgi:hypothetical protein